MMKVNRVVLFLFLSAFFNAAAIPAFAQSVKISNDPQAKKIRFSNRKIGAELNYNQQANISSLSLNGQQVFDEQAGIYSEIKTKDAVYSTLRLAANPAVTIRNHTITISGIRYGDKDHPIRETWVFTVMDSDIKFEINRELSKPILAEDASTPVFLFKNMSTWEGAYQDYGGLAWFYLFNKRAETYGVHSSSSRFWNSKTGAGFDVFVSAPSDKVAMSYTRTANDQLCFRVALSANKIVPRFDSGTNRRRFLRDTTTDVWAPVKIHAGISKQTIRLSCFDFNEQYDRGNLQGINGEQVNAVLNTIARIGVIDKNHFGGNSWHTPYGPICLHEQYIAQIGLAIDDSNYLKGYRECLDFYRDHAVKPDGRVWPRWAYTNEDAMPGQYNREGFYEARWGYLLDANPDLVTNVAELYDQTGDKAWVKTHQRSCEKALDWIIKRDSDHNGLVEMMTDSHLRKKGSDWIDIIWASYENAFVNAKLYHALQLWAAVENQLGNFEKKKYYEQFAQKLKTSFNKPVSEGGFWDEEKKCYIHWREKDNSIHGNNTVIPVNFMAIAYGICDDSVRTKTILDNIETQMQKEQLFFWPLCLYSYEKGEGNDWQFPFPNYENGDIFLSWGALGVKVYADYKPELAVKYVENVLAQYAKDGLAFQRYGRVKQDGLGDDILSGNSLTIVGLFQAIYGINPLYNRLYLDPHLTGKLSGTALRYQYGSQRLTINLSMNNYSISTKQFRITAAKDFGFYSNSHALLYFNGKSDHASLKITAASAFNLGLEIKNWSGDQLSWVQSSTDKPDHALTYYLNGLKAGSFYTVTINGKMIQHTKTNDSGSLVFHYSTKNNNDEIGIVNK